MVYFQHHFHSSLLLALCLLKLCISRGSFNFDNPWIDGIHEGHSEFHGKFLTIFCSEYMNSVTEALELEDTIKNYERRHAIGWFAILLFFFFFFFFLFVISLSSLIQMSTNILLSIYNFEKCEQYRRYGWIGPLNCPIFLFVIITWFCCFSGAMLMFSIFLLLTVTLFPYVCF